MRMPNGPHLGARASCSSSTTHQTSPRKITISSIVDSPDTLNRQNSSVPSSRAGREPGHPGIKQAPGQEEDQQR